MARFLCKAKRLYPIPIQSSLKVPIRHRSSKPQPGQLVQVDMAEYDLTLKLFDDLIHRILVKKATPDWLPFVPGSSFWVPPRPSPSNVVDLVHKLTDPADPSSLSDHESLFLASLRGWPSSNFYINGFVKLFLFLDSLRGWPSSDFYINENASDGDADVEVNIPEGMEGTVKVKVLTFSENVAHSEDEEG